MKVFNIGKYDVVYRNRRILANGGFVDIPLDFIPDRDKAISYLSFGSLPEGWRPPVVAQQETTVQGLTVTVAPVPDDVLISDEVRSSLQDLPKKNKK